MPIMSIRLSDEMAQTLASLAQATGRSKSYLTIDALEGYLEREAWQIAEIQRSVVEADAGDFADPQEVEGVINKWTKNAD